MPFPNEHAARLIEPGKFKEGSFRRVNDKFGAGIHAIFGRLKGEETATLQSIRFDADKFTVAEAKKWLSDNDYKPILFEPATGDEEPQERENKMQQGIFLREYSAESKDITVDIVGVIGWQIWYSAMRDILRQIPETAERVIFEIYSPGGDVWEGNAIIQEIGALKQKTLARVQVAASMATLIAVACKDREIAKNGRWLIHNPWACLQGDAEAFEKRAKELRDCENEAARFYAERTGRTQKEMFDLMEEERWLTPKETLELGFVQKINDPFDQAAFMEVRKEIEAAGKWPKALVEISEENNNEGKESDMSEKKQTEEGKNNDADTKGAEGNGAAKITEPDKPANDAIEKQKDPESIGYTRGQADAKVACEIEHAKQLENLTIQLTKRDDLIREHQSAKDKAEAKTKETEQKAEVREGDLQAKIDDLTQCLKDANERYSKLIGGGLSFTPAGPETWEEAMQLCDGNYVSAAKQYPKLRDEYIERKKQRK